MSMSIPAPTTVSSPDPTTHILRGVEKLLTPSDATTVTGYGVVSLTGTDASVESTPVVGFNAKPAGTGPLNANVKLVLSGSPVGTNVPIVVPAFNPLFPLSPVAAFMDITKLKPVGLSLTFCTVMSSACVSDPPSPYYLHNDIVDIVAPASVAAPQNSELTRKQALRSLS